MKELPNMIIVGAGLAGLVTAWRCLDSHPDLNITLITQEDAIGGNQIWAFNYDDILPEMAAWVSPFIKHDWPHYDVKFPKKERTLGIRYCSSDSDTLRACIQSFIDARRLTIHYKTRVETMNLQTVTLDNGEVLDTHYVVDARGFKPRSGVVHAYKKTFGQTIRTKTPHGLERPIVMDANTPQVDGFAYIACLPLSEHEMLIEHISYSDTKQNNEPHAGECIKNYMAANGWGLDKIIAETTGVLPVTLASSMQPDTIDIDDVEEASKVGMACGYYHAVTGYSFAECLKSALVIDEYIQADRYNFAHGAAREMNQHEIDHFREERFMRLFNRIVFRAIKPSQRYKVFAHIYSQSEDMIARFYRGRLDRNDKLRLLVASPPLSVSKYAKDKSLF